MPLVYLPSATNWLCQGEILGDVVEYRPIAPAGELAADEQVSFLLIQYARVMVMTAACDLEWDFKERFGDGELRRLPVYDAQRDAEPKVVPHVLLCSIYEQPEIRVHVSGSQLWKRVMQNQDERYHRLPEAAIGDPPEGALPDLCLDFKKTLCLPTENLYAGLARETVRRIAVVPPVYVHHLIQRFYSFHSRVGLPD